MHCSSVYIVDFEKGNADWETSHFIYPLRNSSVNVTKSAVTEDLVTFTEEILNGKLHFLCSVKANNRD